MSVALDLSTVPTVPAPALPCRPQLRAVPSAQPVRPIREGAPRRRSQVSVLQAPRGRDAVAPVRLTRRGVVVMALVVAAAGGVLVWLAALSAPAGHAATPAPAAVTVHAGDTVWSIASRYAGDRDPGAIVADIESRNHLTDAQVMPGQVLRLR